MPTLDLQLQDFARERSRAVLDRIGVVMLWPDDETARREALESAYISFVLDALQADDLKRADIDPRELVAIAHDTLPPRVIHERITRRLYEGACIGLMFVELLARAQLDPRCE